MLKKASIAKKLSFCMTFDYSVSFFHNKNTEWPIDAYIGWYDYVLSSLGPVDTTGVVLWPLEWRGIAIGWADLDVIWIAEQGPCHDVHKLHKYWSYG